MNQTFDDFLSQLFYVVTGMEIYEDHLGTLLLIFALYVHCMLPFVYASSYLFTESSAALVRITLFNVLTGFIPLVAYILLYIVSFYGEFF